MLKVGIIEPADSEWTSPPVLVRKKDGSVRWCIDYRKLNNATKKDTYPLPLIEECLDALSGNMYFSTLDMASGYWQIEVEPEDCPKTAFITKYGVFQHRTMPFGLTNAPATFSRMRCPLQIQKLFSHRNIETCLITNQMQSNRLV